MSKQPARAAASSLSPGERAGVRAGPCSHRQAIPPKTARRMFFPQARMGRAHLRQFAPRPGGVRARVRTNDSRVRRGFPRVGLVHSRVRMVFPRVGLGFVGVWNCRYAPSLAPARRVDKRVALRFVRRVQRRNRRRAPRRGPFVPPAGRGPCPRSASTATFGSRTVLCPQRWHARGAWEGQHTPGRWRMRPRPVLSRCVLKEKARVPCGARA